MPTMPYQIHGTTTIGKDDQVASLVARPMSLQLPAAASADQRRRSADAHGKRIGILIVAYNAVTTLSSVLNRIPEEVWNNVEEVAVFDDASPDETHVVGVGYKTVTGIDKLTVLRNKQNLGYGGNQKLGYSYFAEKGFDIVVLLHGDGQYAPEILADLYAPLVNGTADAVFGSRMMKEYGGARKGGMPLYKLLGNKILTKAENRALGMRLSEFHSGYRAYSLAALRRIDMSHMTDDFHFDTEIIIKLNHQGFRIKEVPIPTYYGDEICYVNGMKYARDVFKALVRYKRTVRAIQSYPEFAEYAPHYPLKQSRFSSHDYFLRMVGKDEDVLDIGCGEGFFAQRLVAQNNRVTGVDMLQTPKCADSFAEYFSADLDGGLGDALQHLQGKTYDRILLQDVLEHLRFGDRLLDQVRPMVRDTGLLLVSVPNVANITVRLALLLGRFNYTQRGILDKTHVKFYTRKTARKFLEQHGYQIVTEKMTVMPIELALGLAADNPLMRLMNLMLFFITAMMPGLFGYQCIFAARPRKN
jgi:2-polyprenyl-3-methyl-5-hydroxy-6-metoxy-1,4-benzoquinol methylase